MDSINIIQGGLGAFRTHVSSCLALAAPVVFLILGFFFLNSSFCSTTHWGSCPGFTYIGDHAVRTSCGLSPWGVPGLCFFLSWQ